MACRRQMAESEADADLDAWGEAVLAVSQVVRRKARRASSLVSPEDVDEPSSPDGEFEEDEGQSEGSLGPSADEYGRYSAASRELLKLFEDGARYAPRPEAACLDSNRHGAKILGLSAEALGQAMIECISRRTPPRVQGIPRPAETLQAIAERIFGSISRLRKRFVPLPALLPAGSTKSDVVAAFLALLELARLRRVRLLEMAASRKAKLLVVRR